MSKFPTPIQNLIDEFNKLPGIGPKTSQRFVFYLLNQPGQEIEKLVQALTGIKTQVKFCSVCLHITEKDPCEICSDSSRDQKTICVVANVYDLLSIENTGEYRGLYHILGGVLNPLEGVTPQELRVKELVERIKKNKPLEIILGLNPDLEGESTVIYLTKLLSPAKIKVTRLAKGLPMGADLEYADEVTLSNALKGRLEV